MAEKELKVVASVEEVIHTALRSIANEIYKQHGIMIDSVNIEWLDVSTAGQTNQLVRSVHIGSTTHA